MMMTSKVLVGEPERTRQENDSEKWLVLAAFGLAVLCYVNTLHGAFVFDDNLLIVTNDIIKNPGRVLQVFSTSLWGLIGQKSNYYRPLPALLFMLLHAVFGLNPEPFHVVNVVLHAGTASLVFLSIRALLPARGASLRQARWSAFAGAAVFAAHPVHTEAVAWISGVMDVSCTFFSMLAFYWYVTADHGDTRTTRASLSLVALAAGMLSKEPAVVVPFVLVAYDVLFCRTRIGTLAAALRRWGPPFAVLVTYLSVRTHVLGDFAPFSHEHSATAMDVLLTIPRLFAYYAQILVVPVGLNVLHHLTPVTSPTSREFIWALVVIVAFGGVALYALRVGTVASFGVMLFVLTLAPSLYVPALGQDPSLVFAERYLYFPSVGAAVLFSACLASREANSGPMRIALPGVVSGVVVVFASMTVARNAVWRDSVTLWSDCVRKSPQLGVARESLGLALIARGQVEEGGRELQTALRLDPNVAGRYVNYGIFAAQRGLMQQAIQSFRTALIYKPDLVEAHYSLAVAYEQMGWNTSAIDEYRAVLARNPRYADAHNNLGIILAQSFRIDEALEHFRAAVDARPSDPELRRNLARAYEAKGFTVSPKVPPPR